MPMIRLLSNSLNCEECILTYLSGILRCLKSSYNWHVIVKFIDLPLNVGLYDVLFPIAASLQGVRSCALSPNLDHLHITYYYSYLQSFANVFSFLLGALFSMSLSVYSLFQFRGQMRITITIAIEKCVFVK